MNSVPCSPFLSQWIVFPIRRTNKNLKVETQTIAQNENNTPKGVTYTYGLKKGTLESMEGIIEMWSLCLKDKSAILNPTEKKKKSVQTTANPICQKWGLPFSEVSQLSHFPLHYLLNCSSNSLCNFFTGCKLVLSTVTILIFSANKFIPQEK